MAFWKDVGDKLAEGTGKAMQKAKDLGETAKLSAQISDEQKNLDNYYREIGKLYCYLHGGSPEGQFVNLVNQVNQSSRNIEAYQRQLQQLKGVRVCPKCHTEVDSSAAFCPKCGTMMGQ